jgi:hypothetical protein
MDCRKVLALAVAVGVVALTAGCPFAPPAPSGTFDNLDVLDDTDDDGFKDLAGPEGTEGGETIAVSVVNEITRAEAERVAEEYYGSDIPDGLAAMADVKVNFSITRVYEDGSEFTDTGSRGLETFEVKVEAACPETVIAEVEVVALFPLLPEIVVLPPQEYVLTTDGSGDLTFACGKVIAVTASLDEGTPFPEIDVTIEDQ